MVRLTDRHSLITYSLASSRVVSSVVERLGLHRYPADFLTLSRVDSCAQR